MAGSRAELVTPEGASAWVTVGEVVKTAVHRVAFANGMSVLLGGDVRVPDAITQPPPELPRTYARTGPGWLVGSAPELRYALLHLGTGVRDWRALALDKLSEGAGDWEPQHGDLFEATSPYLDANLPADVEAVLGQAGEASIVRLNEVIIRDVD